MTRVLSALVLLPAIVGIVWWLPPLATLGLALVVAVLAFRELASLTEGLGARLPRPLVGTGVLAVCAALGQPGAPVEGVLMTVTVAFATVALGSGRPGADALRDVSTGLFAVLYVGLPLGALVAVRVSSGAGAVLLLLLTVMASDTAQYYGGRFFGRRPLAPAVSPKKTMEGAVAGFAGGAAAMMAAGGVWLPSAGLPLLAAMGLTLVALGIAGDLFESLLKRGAGVKDASGLIPGHGGMLDRIDSLLFAAPVYYVFLRYGLPG